MKKSRRFTIVVLTVALSLAATGVALYVFVPERLISRADESLAARARSSARYVATYAQEGLTRRNTAGVRRAAELARLEEDLAYAVVVGENGRILASATEDLEIGQEWLPALADSLARDMENSTDAIVDEERVLATVHVGLRRTAVLAGIERDRKLLAGFSGFLILLALGTGIGVVQMERLRSTAEEWQQRHKSVRLQAGTLKSSVREHRATQRHLEQSESKYRSLFESTMASAMADLEELNSHLEKRKADLEHEVGVRKKAEKALRRYTQRLQLLNSIERSLLEHDPVSESARLALVGLDELVPSQRVSLVESDMRRGSAVVLGLHSTLDTGGRALGDNVPFSSVPERPEISHEGDLRELESPTDSVRVVLAEGIRSIVEVPLVVQDEVVGVLTMESEEVRAFNEEHFSIARDVADLLAIGIHRSRLEAEREVYEQELILARDRAEDMARLKTAFLTNMSHEIRTPISGIMGFSQVLHEEVPDGLQEFTGLIQESANRLLNTINSVLELARLESGGEGQESTPMDLVEGVASTAKVLEPAAVRKGLNFTFHAPDGPVICSLDRACVERIVTNLVDNAIKFTDTGFVRVEVTRQSGTARLEVTDTGVGIAQDFIPRLFDEFRQEQMEADREHEGSGLGLAITKKLVDRLGGSIAVSSQKGVGTIVRVEFPEVGAGSAAGGVGREIVVVSANRDAVEMIDTVLGDRFVTNRFDSLASVLSSNLPPVLEAFLVDVNGVTAEELERGMAELRVYYGEVRKLAFASQIIPAETDGLFALGFETLVKDPFVDGTLAKHLSGEGDRAPVRAPRRVQGWGIGDSA